MPKRDRTRCAERATPLVTTLPRARGEEESFSELLYEWSRRTPWLAISAALHAIVLLVLTLFPWSLLERPEATAIAAAIERDAPEPFDQPPPEEPPEVTPTEVPDDPVPRELEATDVPESADDSAFDEAAGEPDLFGEIAFDGPRENPILGIGGGWSGKFGNRGRGGRRRSRRRSRQAPRIPQRGPTA